MQTCVFVGPPASGKSTFIGTLLGSSHVVHSTDSADDVICDGILIRDCPGASPEMVVNADKVFLFVKDTFSVRRYYENVRSRYFGPLYIMLTHCDLVGALNQSRNVYQIESSLYFTDLVPVYYGNCHDKHFVCATWSICKN